MFGIDAAVLMGVLGFVVPPTFHFLKGLFLPDKKDDPESTMSTLAVSKPEVLGDYVEALAKYTRSQVEYFNRDVTGTPSQWIVDLRACIRPSCAAVGVLFLVGEGVARFFVPNIGPLIDPATRGFFTMSVSSWFGSKVFNGS